MPNINQELNKVFKKKEEELFQRTEIDRIEAFQNNDVKKQENFRSRYSRIYVRVLYKIV